jgi:hypothetical protein
MYKRYSALALFILVLAVGCNPGASGVGDPYVSSGTGGEGAGDTGTDGDTPANNPASQTPGPEGTGNNDN